MIYDVVGWVPFYSQERINIMKSLDMKAIHVINYFIFFICAHQVLSGPILTLREGQAELNNNRADNPQGFKRFSCT